MSEIEYKGLEFYDALNVIKQKAIPDAEDIAFLRSRADYLTDEEKAIYFEGKTYAEVYGIGAGKGGYPGALRGAKDRIIVENRPLVEAEALLKAADTVGAQARAQAAAPVTIEKSDEMRDEAAEKFRKQIESANEGADQLEVNREQDIETRRIADERRAEEDDATRKEAGLPTRADRTKASSKSSKRSAPKRSKSSSRSRASKSKDSEASGTKEE